MTKVTRCDTFFVAAVANVATYVYICVPSQILSKFIDIWLWDFAHLFTIMPQTSKQEEVPLSSIVIELCPFFNLKYMWKFAYASNIFKVHWHMALKLCTLVHQALKLCALVHHRAHNWQEEVTQAFWHNKPLLNVCFLLLFF
jgi:hypothetical protein